MELMTKVYTGIPGEKFDKYPVSKYVPYSLSYENALANSKQDFLKLKQEQNLFLRPHIRILMGGIREDSMNTVIIHSHDPARDYEMGLFTGFGATNQTHQSRNAFS
jgi:hypothetical protein